MNSICRRKKPFIVIILFTFLKSAPFVSRCVSLDDKTVFPHMMHQLGAVNLSCFGCNNMFCKLWHVTEFRCQTYVGHTNLTLNNCKTYSQSFKKKVHLNRPLEPVPAVVDNAVSHTLLVIEINISKESYKLFVDYAKEVQDNTTLQVSFQPLQIFFLGMWRCFTCHLRGFFSSKYKRWRLTVLSLCVCVFPLRVIDLLLSQSVKTLGGLGGLLESPLGLRVKPLWDLVPPHHVTGGRHPRQWVGVEAPGNASKDSTVGGGQLVSLWSFTVNVDVLFYLPFKNHLSLECEHWNHWKSVLFFFKWRFTFYKVRGPSTSYTVLCNLCLGACPWVEPVFV